MGDLCHLLIRQLPRPDGPPAPAAADERILHKAHLVHKTSIFYTDRVKMSLDFKDRTIIITGSGGGLGGAYATFFASRGAKVLVNDMNKEAADKKVKEITDAGGQAIANYDSVTSGNKLVDQIVSKWGKIDIIINNAGILRDKSFASMTDKEWDIIHDVHVKGPYSVTHAAWPHMRKAKYGRIVNTASAAGIYGNFGQANYSSAKLSQNGFSKTLSREGAKYNIIANTIAPVAASQMTATVMPPDMLEQLQPEKVVPLVAYLVHESNQEGGLLFEAGAGWYGKVRWERSKGVVFKPDETFTPSAVAARWDDVNDFEGAEYPESITDANYLGFLEEAKKIKDNKQEGNIEFKDKVAVVTGAGNGLGKAYALMYARLGASVIVNDVSKDVAQKVVDEIKKAGGKAAISTASVENGAEIVQTAVDTFGGLHILVNNAGILRDKSFASLTDDEWDLVYKIHVRGTYATSHAAWPIFRKQKYGRIVNTASAVGLYGNFGQANYSTAKSAIIGLSKTLAIEGKKYNIYVNTIAPNAGTAMTATIWPEEMVQAFKPDFVAPVVGYLTSEASETTMGIFEVSGGWCASVRWQRTAGHAFSVKKEVKPEDIKSKWEKICKFDENATNPNSTAESLESIISNFGNDEDDDEDASSSDASGGDDFASRTFDDSDDPDLVKEAKKQTNEPVEYSYDERDVILYNLGIGATEQQLKYTFENDDEFQVLPTFGVIPQFHASGSVGLDWLPNFSPMMLLHGEQYLAIKGPIPTSGTLVSRAKLLEVLDKGKAAAVTSIVETVNKDSGEVVFENQSTVFIRGSGGFGGKKTGKDRGEASAVNKPPSRKPDCVVEEQTLERQAAIYRLSGDWNPLHIDPSFAAVGGFKAPILHGLASFGISGKHVFEKYGAFKSIKVRFAGVVYPGQTLVTEMWKEGNKVIFQSKVKETGEPSISNAAVILQD
ncbi:uncharacterized protein L969DRAFT_610007 [Mixia osmundae IAM 14324]|uniref:Ketoreductase domain-containing protein n=1 Tax=Mixia osmundae (strain CBS 9802 / IAM 14324 / JCM 22182 / KY 12970) TaxID=764103 RepID=G7EAV0_MIXOS|nr:uncharacterized protein L969DRAFT_610007 [Mixia osmundae IAM 14324]KEI36994.1 hypothetical protein L969DRAFT_610007 [Mixia osmundae IAM 14324]GAA99960.1 hypothetical protein E5Q_06663 [Mixia osmundae IAM 14324]